MKQSIRLLSNKLMMTGIVIVFVFSREFYFETLCIFVIGIFKINNYETQSILEYFILNNNLNKTAVIRALRREDL